MWEVSFVFYCYTNHDKSYSIKLNWGKHCLSQINSWLTLRPCCTRYHIATIMLKKIQLIDLWPRKRNHTRTSTIKFSLILHHCWHCVFYSYVPITVISTRLISFPNHWIQLSNCTPWRWFAPSMVQIDPVVSEKTLTFWFDKTDLIYYSKQKIIKMTHFKQKPDILIRTKHQLSAFYYI